MVFNTTFNNILVILWASVLLVEEIVVPEENHRPAASHWQTLSHNTIKCIFTNLTAYQTLSLWISVNQKDLTYGSLIYNCKYGTAAPLL